MLKIWLGFGWYLNIFSKPFNLWYIFISTKLFLHSKIVENISLQLLFATISILIMCGTQNSTWDAFIKRRIGSITACSKTMQTKMSSWLLYFVLQFDQKTLFVWCIELVVYYCLTNWQIMYLWKAKYKTINVDTLVKVIMHINIEIRENVKFSRQKLCWRVVIDNNNQI